MGRLLLVLLAIQATACCSGEVRLVRISGENQPYIEPLFVGDTVPTNATANNLGGMFCNRDLYDARGYPSRFTYESVNPAVISVDANGVLIARSVGQASIRATTDNVTGAEYMRVIPAIKGFSQTMENATPVVGDTVVLHAQALGSDGNPVIAAIFFNQIYLPDLSLPEVGQVTYSGPQTVRLVPKRAGTYRLVTKATHADGKAVVDTMKFTVGAKP